MSKPMIRIHNLSTDEIIDREMNDAEFTQWEIEQASMAAQTATEAAKAAEKEALLAKLGITADEAKLLLS